MKAGARPAGKFRQPQRPSRWGSLRGLLTCSAIFFALPAQAQDNAPPPLPRTNLGGVGLIEMPSARMAPDAELSAGASYFTDTQHYNLGFQIVPWLEGSFRYSGLQHFNPSYPVYWDRSFGLKARLWQEGDFLPALAIGINDVVGTGVYSGEYLVASKQFGDFDATLGIGWGRLGSANTFRNQFAQVSSSFETRPSLTTPGGTNFNVYFHGPTSGVFGGVVWRTPLPGLSAIVESSSDDYPFERVQGSFTPRTQMNYGLSYQATEGITLGLNWLYGKTIGGSASFQFDPKHQEYPGSLGEQPIAPVIRTQEAQQEALRTMLGRRSMAEAGPNTAAFARAADRNAFVDSLLSSGDITDIRVTGHTMSLTIAGGGASRVCQTAAAAAQYSATGISDITVRTGGGHPAVHCSVARAVEPTLQSAVFLSTDNLPGLTPIKAPLLIDATASEESVNVPQAIRKFRADAKKQRLTIEAVSFGGSEAIVYYANNAYLSEVEAVDRLTRLLMADAPPDIEKFRLVPTHDGVPQQEYNVLRAPVERAFSQEGEDASVFDSAVTINAPQLSNPVLFAGERGTYPRFDWSIYPQFRQQFFDPTNPFGVQFVGAGEVDLELAQGLLLWAEGEVSLFDTFSTTRPNDSVLPHVRTDFNKYFTDGKNGIGGLAADYRFRVSPEVFATVKAGYLESMFAGVGGEVLWRPQGRRWAVGADMYEVWQRNYDRLFGLQPYHVFTGHVSLYYASPWYDLDFMLRAGQYLAGDRGVTLQVTRRFSTGVEIGAFFTKTNVSSQDFGEGSFDKGIIIRIPIGWIAPIDTQNQVAMDLRPVQRDGGQVLLGDATLYDETRRASEGEIVREGKTFAN